MKALLISDIHASYRLLAMLCENFKNKKEIGAIIFAGDVVDMGEPVSFVDEFLWTMDQISSNLIWVPGNNDFGRAYHRMNARVKSTEGRIFEYGGHKYTGVGGSPASWSGQYQGERAVDKTEIADTIFISHVPPPGLNSFQKNDESIVNKQDTKNKQDLNSSTHRNRPMKLADAPKVHICGHIHHTWGVGYLGTTKVIKLAGAYLGYVAILDLESLEVKFQNLFR